MPYVEAEGDFYQTLTYDFTYSPNYWASSIMDWDSGYLVHTVDNPYALLCSSTYPVDNAFAHLHAGEYGDYAWITAEMSSTQAHGHIYLYGYSGPEYWSHLRVYVSPNYYNWYLVTDQYIDNPTPHYIDCGYYGSNFRYIAVCGNDDQGLSCCLNIDAVHVMI